MDSGIHTRILQPRPSEGYVPSASRPKNAHWIESVEKKPACIIYDKYWYRRLVPNEKYVDSGALLQKHTIDELSEKIIVCFSVLNEQQLNKYLHYEGKGALYMDTIRLFGVFNSAYDLLKYIEHFPPEERSFYEIILGEHDQKLHFDLDVSDVAEPPHVGQTVLQHVITGCLRVFQQMATHLDLARDVYIFTSHGSTKCSYHIVINNWTASGAAECKFFYQLVLQHIPDQYQRYVDHMVYSNRQQFRILGCQKQNSQRPKIFCPSWLYHGQPITTILPETPDNDAHRTLMLLELSLISSTAGCTYLPIQLPERSSNYIASDVTMDSDQIQQCMRLVHETFPEIFSYMDVKNSLILLRRLQPSKCPMCSRVHEAENAYLLIKGTTVWWHCRRAPSHNFYELGQLIGTEDFTESSDPPTSDLPPSTISEVQPNTSEIQANGSLNQEIRNLRQIYQQKRKPRPTTKKLQKEEEQRQEFQQFITPINVPSMVKPKSIICNSPLPNNSNTIFPSIPLKDSEPINKKNIPRTTIYGKPCTTTKPHNL